ncbi:Uncharacterised protein [Neisseria meningitidis]|nr:Uncharacterised protein [Neisseria meningitidis]
MLLNSFGDFFGFAVQAGIVFAHRALQFGELADHFGNQIGFGKTRGALGCGGIRVQRFSDVGGNALQTFDAFGLRTDFVVVHHVCQLGQAAFQSRFLVLFVEELGIRQARAQDAFVASDDVRRIFGLQVGNQQEAVHQLAVLVEQREVFLVLLHRQNQAFLRHGEEVFLKTGFQNNGVFDQRGYFVQQCFIGGNGRVQTARLPFQCRLNRGFALGKRSDDFALLAHLCGVAVGVFNGDFAVGQEAVSQGLIAALQTQNADVYDVAAVQHNQPVDGAHEGKCAAAPTHHFRNRQFFHCGIDNVFQKSAQRFAGLDVFVGVHVLLAVVDDGQVFDFRPCTACETFQSLGRRTVFYGIRHGRAFFHDFLIGLNGFDVFDLNRQTARRGISRKFGCAVNQLRFFQAFGNGGGKMVAQIIKGFGRKFFGKEFD